MIFKGDITTFDPPDLLMFLSHMGKEGMLSVTQGTETLNIWIKKGMITDAHSDRADGKLLMALLIRRCINMRQLTQLQRIKKETGMSARQILEKLNVRLTETLDEEINNTIMEVLFQFCLMDRGDFQFVDILVDPDTPTDGLPGPSLVLELTRQSDEWHEMKRSLGSLDQIIVLDQNKRPADKLSPAEHLILKSVAGQNTITQLLTLIPLPSYRILKVIHRMVTKHWLRLKSPAASPTTAIPSREAGENQLLSAYKQAYRQILLTPDTKAKTARIIAYCKDFFDRTALVTAKQGRVSRCVIFSKDDHGRLHTKENPTDPIPLESEPVFAGVLRSKRAFFGNLFPSALVDQIIPGTKSGTCAVILLENRAEVAAFLWVVSAKPSGDVTPFHYLELLSWLIMPPVTDAAAPATATPRPKPAQRLKSIHAIVSRIEELPPMPYNVTRVLRYLADPDKSMSDLATVLAEDQSMVARLLKVSNSALYRTGQEIRTLKQALTRLGIKTIRSLVVTASTRALFPMNQTATGMWSRALWQHAKECALSARRVAQMLGDPDPEEAFTAGMLHDVGKLVILLKHTDEYRRIKKVPRAAGQTSIDTEQSILGFDHTQVGQLLMEKWQMPPILTAGVRHHHHPEQSDKFQNIVHIITYANYLSNSHGSHEQLNPDDETNIEQLRAFWNLDHTTAEKIETAVISDLKHADIFD